VASVVLYAVDLGDLLAWVGRGDEHALAAARTALREDEESDWQVAEWELLDRLLRRMVIEGKLYDGLSSDERYYLTQLVVDLFDEFVDSEAVSEEWPLAALDEALGAARRGGPRVKGLIDHLLRGRTLCGRQALHRPGEELDEVLPYIGFLHLDEAQELEQALQRPPPSVRGRALAAWRAVASACRACRETDRDVISLVA
jgi:hypothetical protein